MKVFHSGGETRLHLRKEKWSAFCPLLTNLFETCRVESRSVKVHVNGNAYRAAETEAMPAGIVKPENTIRRGNGRSSVRRAESAGTGRESGLQGMRKETETGPAKEHPAGAISFQKHFS